MATTAAIFADSILNVDASFFTSARNTAKPHTGSLLKILTSKKLVDTYGLIIEQIRATSDKKERDALKIKLPGFTPSGTFSHRSEAGLIAHNGFISFDLDAGTNAFLNADTAEQVKREISKYPEIAYCGLSASGAGVWGLIPLAYPERHKEHFEALKIAFLKDGYIIDGACKDICRFRFWSLDNAPYINPNAKPFKGLPLPAPRYVPKQSSTAPPDDLPAQAAEYLIKNRVPLECTYNFYMAIAFACKHHWGNEGEGIALDILHACTTFAASNTAKHWAQHWRGISRNTGNVTTIGTIVKLAKDAGFKYTTQPARAPITTQPQHNHSDTSPQTMPTTYPGTWERFEGQINQPFELLMTADGYPALWDIPGTLETANTQTDRTLQVMASIVV